MAGHAIKTKGLIRVSGQEKPYHNSPHLKAKRIFHGATLPQREVHFP
jgi:hypothetical protein